MLAATLALILRETADTAAARAAHMRRLAAEHLAVADAADAEAARLRAHADELTGADPSRDRSPADWRERLWIVPPDMRLSVAEAAEALGVSRSYLYHDCRAASPRVPHRRLSGGGIAYTAGELRSHLAQQEILAQAGTMESVALPPVRRQRHRRRHA